MTVRLRWSKPLASMKSCSEATSDILRPSCLTSWMPPAKYLLCSKFCLWMSFIHSSKGNKIQMFMEGQWLMELLSCFSAVAFHTTLCLSWLDLPMYQRGHLLDCGCLHQAALNPREFQFSTQWPQREHSASLLVKPKSVMLNTTVQLSYQDVSMKTNIRVPCGINKRYIVHVC